jgi:hypothetical protein
MRYEVQFRGKGELQSYFARGREVGGRSIDGLGAVDQEEGEQRCGGDVQSGG